MSRYHDTREASRSANSVALAVSYPVDERGYTDTKGAAEYTGLSPQKFNKDRHYGTGCAYVEFGRAIRYSFAALDAWAARNSRTCTRDPEAA